MTTNTLTKIVDETVSKLSPKQQKILSERFGLKNGKTLTLQKIGDELNITRERVRQVIEQALKELRTDVLKAAQAIIAAAEAHLKNSGGVRRDDYFMNDLKYRLSIDKTERYADQKLRFVLWASKAVRYRKEDDEVNAFWYLNDEAADSFSQFTKDLIDFFRTSDRREVLSGKAYLTKIQTLRDCHFVAIPKAIGMNVFGELGLREWPEIEPKTIRDKIYLALKRNENPLHFTDIAKQISKFGIDRRAVHVQTVHNELIKDNRFVLVGRGIYALAENGYQAGTVRQVIVRLMKENGPLSVLDVVRLVNEKRFFKENTILLNLQNRRFFKRTEDGKYQVKEA